MDAPLPDFPTLDYDSLAAQLTSVSKSTKNKLIVDAPFNNQVDMAYLFLGFMCLYVVDENKNEVQLVAASGTEEYARAVERYNFEPSAFHLCLNSDTDNTIVQAISTGTPQDTTDWVSVSRKHSSPEHVRFNQANSGIAYTAIYPFSTAKRGAIMYNFYQYPDKIDDTQRSFMKTYTTLAATHVA